ncbi:MAG: transaldolase [Coxiella sp. (in: Bacteria)]|nr:MAG: transaldolase [Coxiella sp. (in: g-proteobacteria)]
MANPLNKVEKLGQAIWLDYIKRDLIMSGDLKKLIDDDSLRGMTSNPAIFEKSFAESSDYEKDIKALAAKGNDLDAIYTELSERDVRDASDVFRTVYDKTDGKDGFVSLEVNPHLAHDTAGTLAEARRLWKELDRPNVLIKVPATKEGLPVIRQLISEGVNVNVTLLFGVPRYREVAEAYISGLEARAAKGEPVDHIASVASFFLSRIDVMVDPMLEKEMNGGKNEALAKQMHGQVAIASAKAAYQAFDEMFNGDRFKKLVDKGARVQRLLWASTGTKNPDYSDVKYVDSLIGEETVNTVPVATFDAYRDHGDPKVRLTEDPDGDVDGFHRLADVGVNIDDVTQKLEDEGVDKFNKAFDQLFATLKKTAGE